MIQADDTDNTLPMDHTNRLTDSMYDEMASSPSIPRPADSHSVSTSHPPHRYNHVLQVIGVGTCTLLW